MDRWGRILLVVGYFGGWANLFEGKGEDEMR